MLKRKILFILVSPFFVFLNLTNASANISYTYHKPMPSLAIVLEPQSIMDSYSAHIVYQLFDSLFQFDDFLSVEPHLVSTWQSSENGKKYTINLKPNVKFHNGKSLISDDVIFTISRFIKKDPTRHIELLLIDGSKEFISNKSSSIKGLKKISDSTLEISLVTPSPTFIMLLAMPTMGILPANLAGEDSQAFFKHPIGTGPFKFSSYEKNKSLKLVANESYFEGTPKLKEIIYEYVTREQAIAGFNKGIYNDLQWFEPKPEELSHSYNVAKFPLPHVDVLIFNVKRPPFNKKEIRQAIALSIDKLKLRDECFYDKAKALGYIPYGIGGYDPNFIDNVPDINKAKTVIKRIPQSQIPKQFNIIRFENHPCKGKFDEILTNYLKPLNITPQVEYISFQNFLDNYWRQDKYDMLEITLAADYPEALVLLNYFRSNYKDNFSGFAQSRYDDILQKASTTIDKYERYKLYSEAQQILRDEAVVISLYYNSESIVYQKNVRGLKVPSLLSSSLPMRLIYFEE